VKMNKSVYLLSRYRLALSESIACTDNASGWSDSYAHHCSSLTLVPRLHVHRALWVARKVSSNGLDEALIVDWLAEKQTTRALACTLVATMRSNSTPRSVPGKSVTTATKHGHQTCDWQ
jgi:hypothetical protein